MTTTALVVGASSGIGSAIARELASRGTDLVLAGRHLDDLARRASDLAIRHGVRTSVIFFDAVDFEAHAGFFEACTETFPGGLDGIVLSHGDMAEQADALQDFALARRMVDVNYTSAVSLLNRAARYLEARGTGWICAVSSVAGDRGRPSNYLYGSTKAGLTTYLQGLRARLAASGIPVVTVKPGFVDTALTYGRPGMFLVAPPERVARDALRAVRKGRGTVYSPWFWAAIMVVIRLIPERIFHRLAL